MLTATVVFEISYAHHLPGYLGKCRSVHGHNAKIEVTVSGYSEEGKRLPFYEEADKKGMVVDFSVLKKIVKEEVLFHLDHNDLNKMFAMPTAESVTEWIVEQVQEFFDVERVRFWEDSTSYVEWTKE